jgi:predicted PurR-regulated permease PerM
MTTVTQSARISYGVMAVLLFLIAWLHLGPLVLTSLFGYFALGKLRMGRSKHFAVALYIIAVVTIGYLLVHFTRQASIALPRIAEQTIPAVVESAERHGVELPFTDYASAKTEALATVRESWSNVGQYLRNAVFAFAQFLVGLVLAASLFLSGKWGADQELGTTEDSLYATVVAELAVRFRTFYASFSRVIGAQIFISAINTVFTAAFLLWNHFPYKLVLIGVTFLCGLLPIVGNILSNTLIVGVAFTMPDGTNVALFALIFLVVIHKLEYFLNSKIIGDRIKNPMWLTLIGLVLGEKLMGIPGMILAPVVLHYIKVEASQRKLTDPAGNP